MLRPGETEIIQFTVPIARSDISKIIMSFMQKDRELFHVDATISALDDGTVTAVHVLTEEESLCFEEFVDLYVQINVIGNSGDRYASQAERIQCGEQLHYTKET